MISSLELARLSGCSQGTVDRALHDRPGISEKTKKHVLTLAAKHGYRPHPAARELLTGDRRTVGAIIPSINSVFFMDLLNTIREALDRYRFVITQVADAEQFTDALEEFASLRARMVVAVPPAAEIAIPSSITGAMEMIGLANPLAGRGVKNLLPDETETGRIGTRYLIERGHRRIAHATYTRPSPAIRDRAAGYTEVMIAAGLKPIVLHHGESGSLAAQLRQAGVTAVFCHNDWLALSVMRSLNQAGVRVPEDISVLGVDDSPTFVSLCPEITTLHYPAESIAAAVRAIIDGRKPSAIAACTVVQRATVQNLA